MNKLISWSVILSALAGILYISSEVSTYFIVAFVLAYALSPVANWLEQKYRVPRWAIALVIVASMIALFVLLWVFLGPILYEQTISFIEALPKYRLYINQKLLPMIKAHVDKNDVMNILSKLVNSITLQLFDFVGNIGIRVCQSWSIVVNMVLSIILVPICTFYFIRDWKEIGRAIENLLPSSKRRKYNKLITEIDTSLSGFIRGQLYSCLLLATYYSIALSIIKLDFGAFIGVTIGLLSFIPFFTTLGGTITAALAMYFKFKSICSLISIAIAFLIGIVIENTISYTLISRSTGLHSMMMVFAVLLGGNLFGFKGVFLAIPVSAIISTVIRFIIADSKNK
jgi:putative permease